MKKTIAAIALLASANASALMMPLDENQKPQKTTKVCLEVYTSREDGAMYGDCDASNNNKEDGVTLLSNGCGEGQVALTIVGKSKIESCMPAGMVQL